MSIIESVELGRTIANEDESGWDLMLSVPVDEEGFETFWNECGETIARAKQVLVGIVHAYVENNDNYTNSWTVSEFGIPLKKRQNLDNFLHTVANKALKYTGGSKYTIASINLNLNSPLDTPGLKDDNL